MNPTVARFKVQGMHCQSCATSVDWEIEDLDGVADASTSLAAGLTEVSFDAAKVKPEDLLAAIQRAGFSAEPIG
jgi:copper chaperone CopZ